MQVGTSTYLLQVALFRNSLGAYHGVHWMTGVASECVWCYTEEVTYAWHRQGKKKTKNTYSQSQ